MVVSDGGDGGWWWVAYLVGVAGVVGTTFVTITGHRPAYFCALLSATNDNLSLSPGLLSMGTIHNLVIGPSWHLQSCH